MFTLLNLIGYLIIFLFFIAIFLIDITFLKTIFESFGWIWIIIFFLFLFLIFK